VSAADRVIDALNAHDLEAFVACYAADATIEDGHDRILAAGHDALRARYGRFFEEHPAAQWKALMQVEVGSFIVQHEEQALDGGVEPSRHVCVYLLDNDVIARERVLR
jgi:hypothetical protein